MGVHRAESERETTHLLGNSAAGAEQQAAAGARVGETNTKLSWPWPDTAATQLLVLATRSRLRGGDLSDW